MLLASYQVGEIDADVVAGLARASRLTEFLADCGLLHVDAEAAFERWIACRLDPLPATIQSEVWAWIEVLRGRTRRGGRPRAPATIRGYVTALRPSLHAWSERYGSLREVTHDDVLGDLGRLEGSVRRLATSAMRSLFRNLKSHRLIFADPTVRIAPGTADRPPVLALDPTTRATLLGQLDRPAAELTLLLAGVHALRRAEIRFLTLDAVDLAGGTLLVKDARRSLDALTLTPSQGVARMPRHLLADHRQPLPARQPDDGPRESAR